MISTLGAKVCIYFRKHGNWEVPKFSVWYPSYNDEIVTVSLVRDFLDCPKRMTKLVHPSTHIHFRLRCCSCPFLWGGQHMSNTSSPCIFLLDQRHLDHTHWHHSSHIQTMFSRAFVFSAWNRKVCDSFDTRHCPLYMGIPSESSTAKDRFNNSLIFSIIVDV